MTVETSLLRADAKLKLAGAHEILLKHGDGTDELRICTANGEHPLLTVSVSADGIAVRVTGASVTIEATELLKLEAKKLVLSALRELVVESAGAASLTFAGDLAIQAQAQTLTATLGDVQVTANDDVRLNGERVMMNCDE